MNTKTKVFALLALSLMICGCDEAKPQGKAQLASAVSVPAANSPAPMVPSEDYIATGPIVVENQVDVAAQRPGVITAVLADVGKAVRAGERLAILDDRQVKADRDAASAKVQSIEADVHNWEAEVKVLEADKERAEKMWQSLLITKEQLEHVRYKVIADQFELERERHNLQNAQNQLRSLDLELEKTNIAAPFAGRVARRYVRVGQQVAPGDKLFWITAVSPLRVRFTVPEKFATGVRQGQPLKVEMPEENGPLHDAKVILVSPVVDPSSGTIEVLAELVGAVGDLRPGMSARIHIENPR